MNTERYIVDWVIFVFVAGCMLVGLPILAVYHLFAALGWA